MIIPRSIFLLLAVVFFSGAALAQPLWYEKIVSGSVKKDMTEAQVVNVLGTPHYTKDNVWYYQSNSSSGGAVDHLAKGATKGALEMAMGYAMAYTGIWQLNSLVAPNIPGVAENVSSLMVNDQYLANIFFNPDGLVKEVRHGINGKNLAPPSNTGGVNTSNTSNTTAHMQDMPEYKRNAPVYT